MTLNELKQNILNALNYTPQWICPYTLQSSNLSGWKDGWTEDSWSGGEWRSDVHILGTECETHHAEPGSSELITDRWGNHHILRAETSRAHPFCQPTAK